jgi:hypothetical protein
MPAAPATNVRQAFSCAMLCSMMQEPLTSMPCKPLRNKLQPAMRAEVNATIPCAELPVTGDDNADVRGATAGRGLGLGVCTPTARAQVWITDIDSGTNRRSMIQCVRSSAGECR